jgi:hypothetical protein
MTILARLSVGRILLHLLAMLGDRCFRFHFEGIVRALPWNSIPTDAVSVGPTVIADVATLVPSDFERVSTFEVVAPRR